MPSGTPGGSPVALLTTPVPDLPSMQSTPAWVIEFDNGHDRLHHFGAARIVVYRHPHRVPLILSAVTYGCYSDPFTAGRVELHVAEQHRLAVFPSEAAMRAGAQEIVDQLGDQLPTGVCRSLAGR